MHVCHGNECSKTDRQCALVFLRRLRTRSIKDAHTDTLPVCNRRVLKTRSASERTQKAILTVMMDSPPTKEHKSQLESPLPSISERLAFLRPSRELLDFYRQKVAQFDGEHEDLLQMLEKYRSTAEEQHKLQWEVRQREEEIAELQNALSDMQVYLFQEREQALRLYAENDRLKIRELEDRKKIQHLLALVGPDPGEITYFHREPPNKVTIPQKKIQLRSHEESKPRPVNAKGSKKSPKEDDSRSSEQYKRDKQTLLLQVEALQAQMEEQTRLAKEQVEALLEDRRIHLEERQVQHQRDQERITAQAEKLQRTQSLLYESTRDFLQLKFSSRAHEKSWMMEKDRLLRELDSCQERLREDHSFQEHRPSADPPLIESSHTHRDEIRALQEELKQAHKLSDMYRDQCVNLETELSQIREEGDVGREIFKERTDKMANRLQLMTKRYEALEKRRLMEVEGFKTDIKHLRQKVKDVEKHLFKLTVNMGPNQDLAILREVRQTNSRTVKVQDQLKNLKAKIYRLENDLRFC
ncbi:coiled-coil domain-containing protein 77 isoform X2 [Pimephales promelas]|uniref:coiled-coil domain-containing protein 77 isoform X2 n=1 Tax=Pimephales promelas TaxID=90988 RepID=UPI001955C140|nr:coiled-coil domain-containing protein 77 isoform X2 [Pimephales promelas]KAG1957611.1 coiled-coil domain-containing protein [Pimephales promelas]